MRAMHFSVFCYYQDWHVKPDRRSLNRRGYQVLLTVCSISWIKGYPITLLASVIPVLALYEFDFVCPVVSQSVYPFIRSFSYNPRYQVAHQFFWSFCMKLESYKVRNVMQPNFWEKSTDRSGTQEILKKLSKMKFWSVWQESNPLMCTFCIWI